MIDLQQFRFVGPGLGQFLGDALELQDEDPFIIDLRSNAGGLTGNIGNWLYNFIGDWVDDTAQVWVQLRTNTTCALARHSKEGEPRWMTDAFFLFAKQVGPELDHLTKAPLCQILQRSLCLWTHSLDQLERSLLDV